MLSSTRNMEQRKTPRQVSWNISAMCQLWGHGARLRFEQEKSVNSLVLLGKWMTATKWNRSDRTAEQGRGQCRAEQGGRPSKKPEFLVLSFLFWHQMLHQCVHTNYKEPRKGKFLVPSKHYGMQRIQGRTGEEAEQKARIAVRLDSLFK